MENRKRILEVKMDMLRIIGKQSGKTVESVVKKKRNAAVKTPTRWCIFALAFIWLDFRRVVASVLQKSQSGTAVVDGRLCHVRRVRILSVLEALRGTPCGL